MIHLVHDLRYAFRKFRTAPGPIIAVIVTLALGIGANSAIFSLVDAVWLRPLPISDPAHLVAITSLKNHAAADSESLDTSSSFEEFRDVRERVPAFLDVAAVDHRGIALDGADGVQLLSALVVSDNFFTFTGANPELGHLPDESELRTSQVPLIVLSHGTWKRFFAGNPNIVGQTIRNRPNHSAMVVAVLPAGFRGMERIMDPQVYVPRSTWMAWSREDTARTYRNYDLYARLRPGVSLDQARAQLTSLGATLSSHFPASNHGRQFAAQWEQSGGNPTIKRLGTLLLCVGMAILLIASTNIANLLLALHDARRRELAMRAALGARRSQLLRQLVTECTVLAAVGVAVALALAKALINTVPSLIPDIGIPLGADFRIDHRVLIFTCLAGAITVLLCGLLPALSSTRVSPLEAYRAQLASPAKLKIPARKLFVATQLAACMALLTITGMLVHALLRLETADLGFNARQNAVLLQLELGGGGDARQSEVNALLDRVRALPGVKDASMSRVVPFVIMGGGATRVVLAPGEALSASAGTPVWFNQVDNSYFRVIGVPILRGRIFARQDTSRSQRVSIINQTLAKRLFGTEDIVGKHVRIDRDKVIDTEIIGLAQDGKYGDISEAPQPYLYLPLSQDAWSDMALTVTTQGDPRRLLPVVRMAVRQVDPDAIITTSQTLHDHMNFATYANRAVAGLTASLGALAMLLALIGLYGVIAYSVSRRSHEIGIRIALGAHRNAVGREVVGDGLKLVLPGIVVGAAIAIVAAHGIRSLLFGVVPLDAITLLCVTAVMLCASGAALVAPALRALRVNPAVALRDE